MKLHAVYASNGEWAALFSEGHLYNLAGDWIGWVEPGGDQVYSVRGEYVGWLSDDFRILRKRSVDALASRRTPPPRPARIPVPASVPLAPLLRELTYDTIDVFEDMPERLHTVDTIEETRPDMD